MIETNPFAVLTFIAAPAILTNASSVLALGTGNRFARVIDRSRALAGFLEDEKFDQEMKALFGRQLDRCERRAELLIRALKAFYTAVGSFAAAALVSLLGATFSMISLTGSVRIALILALIAGAVALVGLTVGGALLVRETGLALESLREENAVIRRRRARTLKTV